MSSTLAPSREIPSATGYSPTIEPPAPARPPARERLLSLDVFRGMTVAGMLLVNDPGSWDAIYSPLEHAKWNGWTPTDLIFPFFLFIAGITTALSLDARRARGLDDAGLVRQILRRGALIFLFGLFLSWFPGFTWGHVDGVADPTFLQRVVDRLYHVRIMGVLQRIGVAYTAAALLTLRTSLKQQVAILSTILLGYWLAMTLIPVPPHGIMGQLVLDQPSMVLSAWLDRTLLDWERFGNHLWASSRTWDPEGILSTVPAVGTAMLGVFAGRWIGERQRPLPERLNGLFAVGALLLMVGMMWNWVFPINKSLWTSSYVLFAGGMAAVALATYMWVIDVIGVRGWTLPFRVYGMNPMAAFVGSGITARLIYSILKVDLGGQRVSLEEGIYRVAFASWLSPVNASLAFAITFVLVWLGVLGWMYRRGIVFRV